MHATEASDADAFSFFPADLSAQLIARARMVPLTPDQVLFVAGQPGDGCYWIKEGLLKVTVASPTGGERILAILGPGTLLGEVSIVDGAPRSATVSAIRQSRLAFVSRTAFDALAESRPDIYRHLTMLLARRLRDIDAMLAATSFLTLKGRVARALLSLADAFGKDVGSGRVLIRQKIDQSDLAAMAGIARENVNRILQDWTRRAPVSRLSGYYCLENPAALESEMIQNETGGKTPRGER